MIAIVCSCGWTAHASAQSASTAPRPAGRFEVGIGFLWIGHDNLGTRGATETVATGPRFVLFSTSTQLDAALGAEARIGVHLTRVLEVDAEASYSSPELRTTTSDDTENANPAVASIGVKQITIGGLLVAHLPRLRIGARGVPFVEAGAGYLRQLYDTRAAAVSGQMYQFGGGMKYGLIARPGRRLAGLGLRADLRAVARTKGVAPDGRTHMSPAASASLWASF